MKAVVMAGGEGSRLRPITANRPKPLVPVGNVPIMQHIIELVKRHGVTDVVVTLHYLADAIQSYFDDGSDYGLNITYSIEDTPLGTAGSVKQAEAKLKDGTFIIISGDAMTDCDLTKALEYHRQQKSLATIVLCRVSKPPDFGVVIVDDDGRITRFLEKPSWSEVFSDTVNTGIYILEPEILDLMELGRQYDWSQDIFPELLRQEKPLYGYIMDDYWCDVGTLEQYREAQEHLLSRQVDLKIPGEEARSGIWIGPHTSIDERVELVPPVCIGRNSKIKGAARIGPYTVLGDNVLVEDGAIIERSVIWEGTYVGPGAVVQANIVGSKVTIKRDCILGEGAVIGDRCLLDTGSVIRAGIKLWPDKVIERGSTVTYSLVWGNKWRGTLFRELGVAGLSNIEITPEFATRLGSAFGSILPDRATVVTSRDSTRSSRMIKRAIMASLLSVGCDVLDMQSAAVPIARHFIRTAGAAGAVNVRKLPGNSRVTLVEFFDARGNYLSKGQERKVETAFFREDFHRIDPEDLGAIEYSSRAIEDYQNDFFRLLPAMGAGRRPKIVCDFGFGSMGSILPGMLGRLGIDAISINGYNDSKKAPRSPHEIARHSEHLQQIVSTLAYDFGVLFTNEGERVTVVDEAGTVLDGYQMLAVMAGLVAQTTPNANIALSVTAPQILQEWLEGQGAKVIRTKSDTRSLMAKALEPGISFAGDNDGGFIFPQLHPGFDSMFAVAQLFSMLQISGLSLRDVVDTLPAFSMAYQDVRCPWESKGSVMRRLAEIAGESSEIETMDGIKINSSQGWVLAIPDSFEPIVHVYAEGESKQDANQLVSSTVSQIEQLQSNAPSVVA
jgi:mannose-1-phosphate guanylyltransferase/phosphomannomutase